MRLETAEMGFLNHISWVVTFCTFTMRNVCSYRGTGALSHMRLTACHIRNRTTYTSKVHVNGRT